MKKYLYPVCFFLLTSCLNNGFMDRTPQGNPTAQIVFKSYDNFKSYAWGLYEVFPSLSYSGDNTSDDISYNQTPESSESSWIRGLIQVPGSKNGTAWNGYGTIRRVNLMLDHIDQSSMSQVEKDHWRSVGYFFRSYSYFNMLSAYGGVPWIDHVLNDSEMDIIKGPRASRDEVARNILDNLLFAEQNIKEDGDGANTINTSVVRALISRFTLFEGTWRKYHGLDGQDVYFEQCKRVSSLLINKYPAIHQSYDDLFCSNDLSGIPGIILYKPYSNAAGVVHSLSISGTTGSSYMNPTRDLVDSYLCFDGKPRWTSEHYLGDKDLYNEFSNRDHRLWLHVTPPYKVDRSASNNAWDNKWCFTDNPKDRSFIDSIEVRVPRNNKERQKTLPFRQGFEGGILGEAPHFDFYLNGQPWYKSAFGYNNWKYFNTYLAQGAMRNEETDMPVFRIEEIMLNYAEVMTELGEFTQETADLTINKLRARVNVAPMNVGLITDSFDPKRDQGNSSYEGDYAVNPLLWEVRRERRIEMFSEGIRFDDLRRWKKCHYMMKKKLGQFVRKSDFPANVNVRIDGGGSEGYLEFHPAPANIWPEHYYLYPLPLNELNLNPNLKQNPGW